MKSPVIASLSASLSAFVPAALSRPARAQSLSRASVRPVLALLGAACVLTLSGCYYPYGYYPAGYSPYYATAPAGYAQQEVPVGQYGPDNGAPPQQQANPNQQPRANVQTGPDGQQTYAVAAPPPPPPVYAPAYAAYPAYYPAPVYPAYYGYPGWYGPSVSIGFGWGGGHYGHGYRH